MAKENDSPDKEIRDSYEEFFTWLVSDEVKKILSAKNSMVGDEIKKVEMRAAFWKFGIEQTIFVAPELAAKQFDSILSVLNGPKTNFKRTYNGKECSVFYLRKEKNTEYQKPYRDFYKKIFNIGEGTKNNIVFGDNNIPRKTIHSFVADDECDRNYQCSHVFERSLNPAAYISVWNMALTPKMFDPLTGHEAKGIDAVIFQILFQGVAYKLHQECIKKKYNEELLNAKKISDKIEKFTADAIWREHAKEQWKEIDKVEFPESLPVEELLKKYFPPDLADEIYDETKKDLPTAFKIVCEKVLKVNPDFITLNNSGLTKDGDKKKWLIDHPGIVMIEFKT